MYLSTFYLIPSYLRSGVLCFITWLCSRLYPSIVLGSVIKDLFTTAILLKQSIATQIVGFKTSMKEAREYLFAWRFTAKIDTKELHSKDKRGKVE